MSEDLRFFRCTVCGNLVLKFIESGAPMICCGREMKLLEPGTTDGAIEKHVPIVEEITVGEVPFDCKMVRVKVGEDMHPMEEFHYIQWIVLQTDKTVHKVKLTPGQAPEATFCLCAGETVVAAYEFCNQHGLWKG